MAVPDAEASNPNYNPNSTDLEKADLEKDSPAVPSLSSNSFTNPYPATPVTASTRRLQKWNSAIESLAGLEVRGITRVPAHERHATTLMGYIQMSLLWFSANLTANNLAVAFLGPLIFELGFLDSAFCSLGGAFLGCLGTAYMSVWGAESGCRTMVVARFFMGYWPSKLCAVLNIVIMVGYGMIDCVIGGQILSAVSGGSMTILVGITIVAFISWIVAVFGMVIFHCYERWAWVPQLLVLFILIGSAGPKFNTNLPSVGDQTTVNANRLSFFSLCLSVPVSWAAAASDFYVYYPENTKKWKIFLMTFTGLFLSYVIVNLLGIGLASGIGANPGWSEAIDISSGALILAGYSGLGAFANVCGVIIALGVIANNIPGTYSAALGFQMLGRYPLIIPRYLWTCLVVLIYFVCALAGRDHLFTIFQNFLALMGYWVTIFITIVLEEHLWFRRTSGFDWSAWNDPSRLPVGLAALTAFLIGWAGCIVGMYQVWYEGPIAILAGGSGADLGIWIGCGFSLVTYPPLRMLELRIARR